MGSGQGGTLLLWRHRSHLDPVHGAGFQVLERVAGLVIHVEGQRLAPEAGVELYRVIRSFYVVGGPPVEGDVGLTGGNDTEVRRWTRHWKKKRGERGRERK